MPRLRCFVNWRTSPLRLRSAKRSPCYSCICTVHVPPKGKPLPVLKYKKNIKKSALWEKLYFRVLREASFFKRKNFQDHRNGGATWFFHAKIVTKGFKNHVFGLKMRRGEAKIVQNGRTLVVFLLFFNEGANCAAGIMRRRSAGPLAAL